MQFSQEIKDALDQIEKLLASEYDWEYIDYLPPEKRHLDFAKGILSQFVSTLTHKSYIVKRPYVSNSPQGGAKLEWHADKRSLYLELNCHSPTYTKITDNPNGTTTIDSQDLIPTPETYLSLWKWYNA